MDGRREKTGGGGGEYRGENEYKKNAICQSWEVCLKYAAQKVAPKVKINTKSEEKGPQNKLNYVSMLSKIS